MRMDGLTEMENKSSASSNNFRMDRDNITGEDEYMAPLQEIGMGATTSPAQSGLIQGFSAGGGEEAVTKKFVIDDEEALVEEARRLDMEVELYDLLLKRAQLEAMKIELEKLSPKKINLSGLTDSCDRDSSSSSRHAQDRRARLKAWRC